MERENLIVPKILFIRVAAATYDEKEVPRAWPVLYAAVWPDKDLVGVDSPAKLARKIVPSPERGVLELADAFVEYMRFGNLAGNRKQLLQPVADKLESLRRNLDDALGDRDVRKAEGLCTAIEDALDNAERFLR